MKISFCLLLTLFFFFSESIFSQSKLELFIVSPNSGQKIQVADKDISKLINWWNAVSECNKLGEGWRLPTIEELEEIYNKLFLKNRISSGFQCISRLRLSTR